MWSQWSYRYSKLGNTGYGASQNSLFGHVLLFPRGVAWNTAAEMRDVVTALVLYRRRSYTNKSGVKSSEWVILPIRELQGF